MKKKLSSLVLALVLLLGCLPLMASAEDTVWYEYDCGAAGHLGYRVVTDDSGKYIEIGSAGEMDVTGRLTVPTEIPTEQDGTLPVKSIAAFAFSGNRSLTAVALPEGLLSIGGMAFNACTALTSLNIPASVMEVGEGAFSDVPCEISTAEENQKYVSLSGGFLCENDGENTTLLHCPKTSGALEIPEGISLWADSALPSNAHYSSVTLPASLSETVLGAGRSPFEFRYISSERWEVAAGSAAYASEDGVLYTAGRETLLKYPAGKTDFSVPDSVTQLGAGAFKDCTFQEADMSGLNITMLPVFAFSGSSLETIELPAGLQSIGGFAFQDCTALRALSLPNSVTQMDTGVFAGCTALRSLHLSAGLTDVGLENSWEGRPVFDPEIVVTADAQNPSYLSDDQGCLYKKDGHGTPVKLLRAANGTDPIVLPDTVTELANGAFYGCEAIPAVTLPEGLRTIGVMAFQNCVSLRELTIPAGVTEIYSLCAKTLSSSKALSCQITVAGENSSFYSYDGALYRRDGSVLIFAPDKSAVEIAPDTRAIGSQAFALNTTLQSVDIPASVTEIGAYAFYGCDGLRLLVCHDGLKRISQAAFATPNGGRGNRLTTVLLPNSITYMGTRVFENCNALVWVKTGSSAAQAVSARAKLSWAAARSGGEPVDGRLDDVIVANCPELTTLEIPGDVREIAATIYENCPKLTRIYVPAGVSAICEEAFAGLDGLTLYGEAGSYAEAFAEAHQIPFVSGKPQDAAPPVKPDPPVSDDPVVETKITEDGNTVTTTTQTNGDKEIEVKTPAGETVANIDLPADPGEGKSFVDVKEGDWFEEAVNSVTAHGLFSGTGETTFTPNGPMTRGMVAQVLHNLSGGAAYGTERNAFQDVKGGIWYEGSVNWAAETGIVFGTSAEKFSPEQSVTREQLVTMLYRYAKLIGADSKSSAGLERFPDAGKVSGYARPAMEWAVKEGLITGRAQKGGDFIAPQGTATRAEVALILTRFVKILK